MLKWNFYGDGLDSLRIEDAPVPQFTADELLVRQDACGLCFSDTKVIALGANHPRMAGRDLQKDPVTLGHEVSCTVIGVGDHLRDRFKAGDRFIVQADVFYRGVSMAYGYAISGGLAEYSIIPKAMIEGDEGCYLLPIQPDAGYAETALVEPWACVVSAYVQAHRTGIKHGGHLLVIAGDAADADWSTMFDRARPRTVCIAGASPAFSDKLSRAGRFQGKLIFAGPDPDWAEMKTEYTRGSGFDDIVAVGDVHPEWVEGAASVLANHGILNLVGPQSFDRKLTLDIGRIHYNWHWYIGTSSNRPADAYRESRSAELTPNGYCWLIGAGGPMGQMHVQRAIQLRHPPQMILATDIDSARLQSVADRFEGLADKHKVDLVTMNPNQMTSSEFEDELRRLTSGHGFDDIVSLVPVPALIEHAADFLADGGWFNIFAGVARGTMASIDVNRIKNRTVRLMGSSGSSIADMRNTLEKVESGELSTNLSLAAIGGMKAARDGIAAVKDGRFAGKTLIFPLIPDLPLTPLPDLKNVYPSVYERLKDGQFWTREAEEELLKITVTSTS